MWTSCREHVTMPLLHCLISSMTRSVVIGPAANRAMAPLDDSTNSPACVHVPLLLEATRTPDLFWNS